MNADNLLELLQRQIGTTGTKGKKKSAATTKYKRWNKDGEAAKFLTRGLKSGKIDPNELPKTVYDRYPEMLSMYKLENFRSQFNNLKTALGVHVRRDDEAAVADEAADDDGTY